MTVSLRGLVSQVLLQMSMEIVIHCTNKTRDRPGRLLVADVDRRKPDGCCVCICVCCVYMFAVFVCDSPTTKQTAYLSRAPKAV